MWELTGGNAILGIVQKGRQRGGCRPLTRQNEGNRKAADQGMLEHPGKYSGTKRGADRNPFNPWERTENSG